MRMLTPEDSLRSLRENEMNKKKKERGIRGVNVYFLYFLSFLKIIPLFFLLQILPCFLKNAMRFYSFIDCELYTSIAANKSLWFRTSGLVMILFFTA